MVCQPTALQLEIYERVLSSRVVRSLFQAGGGGGDTLACIGALKKLCNTPTMLSGGPDDEDSATGALVKELAKLLPPGFDASFNVEHSGKMKVLAELLTRLRDDCPNERVVLVSHSTKVRNQ